MALSGVQVIATLDSTYSIGLPDFWFDWTRAIIFFGDLDWDDWFVPSACFVGSELDRRLLVRSLAPLVVIVAVPLVGGAVYGLKYWSHASPSTGDHLARLDSIMDREHQPKSLGKATARGLTDCLPISLVLMFCFTVSCDSISSSHTDENKLALLTRDASHS